MGSTGNSYSSTHMRERDKILEDKHQKELAIIERKIEKLKWSNNDTLKQLFEMQTRADRLARNLGFYDIYEAQVHIDNSDHELPYKECLESVSKLKGELSAEKKENERLQELLRLAEEEKDQLKTTAATAERKQRAALSKYKSLSETLTGQMEQLQSRYDALSEVKERAAARYKLDYSKWRSVKNWIFNEKADGTLKGLSEEERKQREFAQVLKKKELLMELGLESVLSEAAADEPSNPPLNPNTNLESNKENQTSPVAEGRKGCPTELRSSPPRQLPVSATMVKPVNKNPSPAPTALRNLQIHAGLHPPPSCSPSIFFDAPTATARTPLTFRPVLHISPPIKREIGSSPLLSNIRSPRKRRHLDGMHAASSDTEDDSQAVGLFPAPTAGFKVPEPPSTIRRRLPVSTGSSDTEAESQSQMIPISTPSGPPARPKQPSTAPMPSKAASDSRRRSDIGVVSRDAETLQPLKMRRLSGNELREPTSSSRPQEHTVLGAGHYTSKSAGKRKAVDPPLSTPKNATTTGQKRIDDYSAFKGRGRYAKDSRSANKSINATYAIDPTRNAGLDFQYDEVVRRKDDRRRMDASDCECCRDYYEAVGPLPNRLQAPLWRSPTNSPSKPCLQHQKNASGSRDAVPESRQSEIDSHKQAISRHRHHWARANTPPGYWNIGFPDTQEAENINEQAREMHKQKRAEVEGAVKRGDGRYKKR